MSIAEMREYVDAETVENALEAYEELATAWRANDMETCCAAQQ